MSVHAYSGFMEPTVQKNVVHIALAMFVILTRVFVQLVVSVDGEIISVIRLAALTVYRISVQGMDNVTSIWAV